MLFYVNLLMFLRNRKVLRDGSCIYRCSDSLLCSLCHSLSVDLSLLQRWCKLLEKHRCPEAPEALRAACAQALCLCGVHVVTRSLTGGLTLKELSTRYNKEVCFDNSISLGSELDREGLQTKYVHCQDVLYFCLVRFVDELFLHLVQALVCCLLFDDYYAGSI